MLHGDHRLTDRRLSGLEVDVGPPQAERLATTEAVVRVAAGKTMALLADLQRAQRELERLMTGLRRLLDAASGPGEGR